jgi:hypothetical protein
MNESTLSAPRSNPAPVVLFAYMRPEHLRRTITSLLGNAEAEATHLTVFCDAPKRSDHQPAVDEVRRYVDAIEGFASVTRVYRTGNMGLARSIIDGVTQTLRDHDRVIVLEDDLLLSPYFLRYMNDGLACYQDDDQVASIQGHWYSTGVPLPETFFLKGADCWGWATWSRAWAHFESDGRRLLEEVRKRNLSHEIDHDGQYPHMKILKRQVAGSNDSWAIRWHLSCYLRGMLSLYPAHSLVENIGHDASGTNCGASDTFSVQLADSPVRIERIDISPSEEARMAIVDFFRSNKQSLLRKAWSQVAKRWIPNP